MRSASTYFRGAAMVGASLLFLGLPAAAAAASDGENTPLHLGAHAAHHAAGSGSGILRTIVALVIVIGLIYVIARVLKAVKGTKETKASGDGLEHLATLPLSAGRSVALVRSGSDVVLVGISESGVTPIKVYTEAEALANGIIAPALSDSAGLTASAIAPGAGFMDALRRMTVRA